MTKRFNLPVTVAPADINNRVRSGAKLYFYEPSTLTQKDVYSDAELVTPRSQPVIADSTGVFPSVFVQSSNYRVKMFDANNVPIFDEDDVDPGLAAGFGVESVVGISQGGTGATSAASARSNLGAASSSSVTAIGASVTDLVAQVETGLNEDDVFGALAALDEVTRTEMAAGTGQFLIQRVRSTTLAGSSISTNTPFDSSIPQISEGSQIFSQSFTPLSASSTIRIFCEVNGQTSTSDRLFIMHLHKDAGANALSAVLSKAGALAGNGFMHAARLDFQESSGSTDARTYTVRCGVTFGESYTVNAPTLGGVNLSLLIIEEWVTV